MALIDLPNNQVQVHEQEEIQVENVQPTSNLGRTTTDRTIITNSNNDDVNFVAGGDFAYKFRSNLKDSMSKTLDIYLPIFKENPSKATKLNRMDIILEAWDDFLIWFNQSSHTDEVPAGRYSFKEFFKPVKERLLNYFISMRKRELSVQTGTKIRTYNGKESNYKIKKIPEQYHLQNLN